jgi:hypothetical protein
MNINNNSLNEYIDICICSNGSHYDVSKVIYELIKDKFSYCGKNIWKYNNNDKIIIDEKQINLKNELRSNVINVFILRGNYWDDKALIESNINISNDYRIKSSILLQIANKLKDSKYIIHIIKELKQFFHNIIDE